MDHIAIEIRGLVKSFKGVKAVQDVSFSVRRGELFAFLGVNGAGKSTTISILCGQLKKDCGTVLVNGVDVENDDVATKRAIGVVFQNSVLDRPLTVRQNLESRAALYGIVGAQFEERLAELSALLDFSDILDRAVGRLSGGQRRRVDIARAILHRPSILVLDEPTTGLDPQTRHLLWEVVERLRREEKLTVLLTTHYMEEAAEADYVVILDAGKIVAEGKPHELKSRYTGDYVTLYGVTAEEIKTLGIECEEVGGGLRFSVKDTAAATDLIVKHPHLFRDYEVVKGRMDDVFMAVTGKRLGGDQG